MNLRRFSAVNLARCTSPGGFGHALASWSPAEWTNAIAGEVGEAANLTKKLLRHRDGVAGNVKPEDRDTASLRERAAKELGDVFIYCDLAIQALGFDTSEIVARVFNAKSDELGCPIRYDEPTPCASDRRPPAMSAPGGTPQGDSVPAGPREARLREGVTAIVTEFAVSSVRSPARVNVWFDRLARLVLDSDSTAASPSPDETGVADAGASGDE